MQRSSPYVSKPSEDVKRLIEQVREARLYLVQESGPTSFVLKGDQSDRKYRVSIGDRHYCTCNEGRQLCLHTLFVMIKIFRLPPENPLVWQTSLIDNEITEIIRGRNRRIINEQQKKKPVVSDPKDRLLVDRRPIEAEDVCAICQDEIHEEDSLAWCRYSCGNNIHAACLQVWARHRSSIGETLTCPLCRNDWGDLNDSKVEKPKKKNERAHYGITCRGCRALPLEGSRFRCTICVDFNLCSGCFEKPIHTNHPFDLRENPSSVWTAAERVVTITHEPSPHLIAELQQRDISENDYDVLLQFDATRRVPAVTPEVFISKLSISSIGDSEPTENCHLCQSVFCLEEKVATLDCGHRIHEECCKDWFVTHHTCPIDHIVLYTPVESSAQAARKKATQKRKPSRSTTPSPSAAPPPPALGMSIMGTAYSGSLSNLQSQSQSPSQPQPQPQPQQRRSRSAHRSPNMPPHAPPTSTAPRAPAASPPSLSSLHIGSNPQSHANPQSHTNPQSHANPQSHFNPHGRTPRASSAGRSLPPIPKHHAPLPPRPPPRPPLSDPFTPNLHGLTLAGAALRSSR
eukprot:TRINITY_DN5243_c0_g1_i2.p1 TRINITY_DN5243_c0_g1~~TRINITY_DN5243_c0_g1_i2.p1  ORF type:complete len:572 (+),score=71.64 TRINITY_DN5243_c0_g1_i2:114-1829(+)